MDVERLRLDRQRLFVLQIIRGIIHDKIKALQQPDHDNLGFLPGERTTL